MSSTIPFLITSIITAAIAQLFLKKGASALSSLDFSLSTFFNTVSGIFRNPWLLTGMFLFAFSFFFYIITLSRLKLNLAYPVMVSTGIVLIAIGSWAFLGETLNWLQVIGIALIILGIFFLIPKV